ncbi:phosphoribosyl pyrophosphokinase [Choiromyces venosus 120613-1]|uniref:Phosphoribosyl pyrophosphokinase n=1 Tax=Choiromyces venosus 120613-1 TaxID=1336337 RepID=A0A3N4JMP1_9PEZI|nr:phosphoribosyl pyrophosphokinase [Choiromyces venosus 120613-1]
MVRNIVVLGGSSHPDLVNTVCHLLGIPNGRITLSKFAVGETRVEIQDSVRGKDVFVIQSGCGKVNDHLVELLITISACKTASAKRVTAVLPHFPYSRQSDIPYNKTGAPLSKAPTINGGKNDFTFESRPGTPGPMDSPGLGVSHGGLERELSRIALERGADSSGNGVNGVERGKSHPPTPLRRTNTADSSNVSSSANANEWVPPKGTGYKQWVAQAGTLVADLLTCAGADHIITMDLHDPQYQGFFDIPVDNLYGRPLLQRYIKYNIPDYQNAVIVSPDAGGAKRATAIADALGMEFALIHKERRPTRITDRQNATMMLVGDIAGKVAILVDDMADTSNTITRAAKLLKGKGGATRVYALVTHGVFSGDAIDRINASALDKVITTNSVPQDQHKRLCDKLVVLDVGEVFAEAIRRVHHGESISVLFRND